MTCALMFAMCARSGLASVEQWSFLVSEVERILGEHAGQPLASTLHCDALELVALALHGGGGDGGGCLSARHRAAATPRAARFSRPLSSEGGARRSLLIVRQRRVILSLPPSPVQAADRGELEDQLTGVVFTQLVDEDACWSSCVWQALATVLSQWRTPQRSIVLQARRPLLRHSPILPSFLVLARACPRFVERSCWGFISRWECTVCSFGVRVLKPRTS